MRSIGGDKRISFSICGGKKKVKRFPVFYDVVHPTPFISSHLIISQAVDEIYRQRMIHISGSRMSNAKRFNCFISQLTFSLFLCCFNVTLNFFFIETSRETETLRSIKKK